MSLWKLNYHNVSGLPQYDTYETSDGKYMAVGPLEAQFLAQFYES